MVGELIAGLLFAPFVDDGGEGGGGAEPKPLGKAVAVLEVDGGSGKREGVHIVFEPAVGILLERVVVAADADVRIVQEKEGRVADAELDVVPRKCLFPRGFLLCIKAECQSHRKDDEKKVLPVFHIIIMYDFPFKQ